MNIILIGGRKTLYHLSRTFLEKGHTITIVNRDREDCTRIARQLKATVVCGEGSDPVILEEAGARGADVLLAMTPHDQDNLVICQLANQLYQVKRTVALVNDPDNEEVFQRLGIRAFSTVPAIARLIEQRTLLDEVRGLLPLAGGQVNITEVAITMYSPVVHQNLRDIHLPPDSLVAVIIRDELAIIPRGDSTVELGDRVVLITTPQSFGPAHRQLTGEKA